MSNSIRPSSISISSNQHQNQSHQDSTSISTDSHSSTYDHFPRHLQSESDHHSTDTSSIHHHPQLDHDHDHPIPGLYPGEDEPHPRLMMRGTTAPRSSNPSNQSHSPLEAFEPNLKQTLVDLDEPRKCWICYDDEEIEPLESNQLHSLLNTSSTSTSTSSQFQKNRKWVKPCRCSLVAHESCLLTWVTTYQLTHSPTTSISSRLSTPVTCPQCSAPYHLSQPSSHLLTIIDSFKRPYDKIVSWSALGGLLLGLTITTSSYGIWASRSFLGPIRWKNWIMKPSGEFSFSKFFQLSLVGPILLLSRTNQLDSILPFLPISLIVSNLAPLGLDQEFNSSTHVKLIQLDSVFPPGPALTVCLIPWFRIAWNSIWSRFTSLILSHEYKSLEFMDPSHGLPTGLGLDGGVRPTMVPNPIGHQAEGLHGAEDRFNPIAAAQDGGRAQLGAEVVLDYTTLRGAIRMGMEALLLPGVASMMGSLLLRSSKHLPWLLYILTYFNPTSTPSIWFKLTSSLLTITGLRFTNQFKPNRKDEWNEERWMLRDDENELNEDPIWWRNTLGGCLIVLVKDVMGLIEKVLKIRKLSKRRILDVV
ncbi:hypothetical protein DFH28DRAFT_1092864 [Melampsora americana]|nr:hypothetical protein DFH28DRAFT_1092864 [Melampsora americana]